MEMLPPEKLSSSLVISREEGLEEPVPSRVSLMETVISAMEPFSSLLRVLPPEVMV